MAFTRKEMKEFFDLTKHEEREALMRKKALAGEIQEDQHQAAMLENFIEHLDDRMLMAIHSTNTFPVGGIIKPTGHYLFNGIMGHSAESIIKDSKLRYPRMTLHFTLNYAIKGVNNGLTLYQWDCKYAILIPFIDMKKRVISLKPVDTWIIGQLSLPRTAEVLVPEKEYFSKKHVFEALSGRVKVIPYPKEENLRSAVVKRLKNKGYPVTNGGDHGWFERAEFSGVVNFIEKSHFLTPEEKYRLKQKATKSNYLSWGHLFTGLAEKIGAGQEDHEVSFFRRVEHFSDKFYGLMFNPIRFERETLLSKFMERYRLDGLTFQMMAANAEIYGEKIGIMLSDKVYSHHQEKKDLKKLQGILNNIKKFCSDLQVKAQLAYKKNSKITLGEFLKEQKIID